jgi:hypothetical protein
MDSILRKNSRQDLQDNTDFLVCHIPEENDKTNASVAYMSNLSSVHQNLHIRSLSPKAMLFPGFIPESLEKNPVDPVNPV